MDTLIWCVTWHWMGIKNHVFILKWKHTQIITLICSSSGHKCQDKMISLVGWQVQFPSFCISSIFASFCLVFSYLCVFFCLCFDARLFLGNAVRPWWCLQHPIFITSARDPSHKPTVLCRVHVFNEISKVKGMRNGIWNLSSFAQLSSILFGHTKFVETMSWIELSITSWLNCSSNLRFYAGDYLMSVS